VDHPSLRELSRRRARVHELGQLAGGPDTDVERDALTRRRAIDTRLAALVKAAADAQEIRADIDPRLVSRLLFGMVNSISEWYRPAGRAGSPDDVVDAVVSVAMEGLEPRRHPR